MAHKQPLTMVASSRANHSPVQVGGSVYRNELSWWGTTSPPIPGCWNKEINYKFIENRFSWEKIIFKWIINNIPWICTLTEWSRASYIPMNVIRPTFYQSKISFWKQDRDHVKLQKRTSRMSNLLKDVCGFVIFVQIFYLWHTVANFVYRELLWLL